MMLMSQVVTTVDGVAVTTGTVVQLPQTCKLPVSRPSTHLIAVTSQLSDFR